MKKRETEIEKEVGGEREREGKISVSLLSCLVTPGVRQPATGKLHGWTKQQNCRGGSTDHQVSGLLFVWGRVSLFIPG